MRSDSMSAAKSQAARGWRPGQPLLDVGDGLPAEHLAVEPRVVDLAVEVRVDPVRPLPGAGNEQRRVVGRQGPDRRRPLGDHAGRIEGEGVQRVLVNLDLAGAGIEGDGDEVPGRGHPLRPVVHARNRRHPRPERLPAGELFGLARGVGDPEGQPALVVDEDAVAAAGPRPLGEHALDADKRVGRCAALAGRRDPRSEAEAAGQAQRRMIGHERVRAERQLLPAPGVLAVGGRVDDRFLDARTGRVRVAVDQSHDVRPVARHLAADHEPDGLARLHAQAIGVADDAPLDEVLGHLLADAHVRPHDGRSVGALGRRRLHWPSLRRHGNALRHDAAGGPCRSRGAGSADRLQERAPAHLGGWRGFGRRDLVLVVIVGAVRSQGALPSVGQSDHRSARLRQLRAHLTYGAEPAI